VAFLPILNFIVSSFHQDEGEAFTGRFPEATGEIDY
jgi:hypothetical protein